VLQGSGTLLQVKVVAWGGEVPAHAGLRGCVGRTPTKGVHWRFMQAMAAIPFDDYLPSEMFCAALTYHKLPANGRLVQRQFKAFLRQLDRTLGPRGEKWGCIWCKEFQKRGAVHLHLVLRILGDTVGMFDKVREAWLSATGQGEDMYAWCHAVQCSKVENMHNVKAYEMKYMGDKKGPKAYEKVCPEWFQGNGRWWGVVGAAVLEPAYSSFQLQTVDEVVQVKRLLRSYVHSLTRGKYTPKSYNALAGMTVLAHGGDMAAWLVVKRWVTMLRQDNCVVQLP
jgi:hypothetical protein